MGHQCTIVNGPILLRNRPLRCGLNVRVDVVADVTTNHVDVFGLYVRVVSDHPSVEGGVGCPDSLDVTHR